MPKSSNPLHLITMPGKGADHRGPPPALLSILLLAWKGQKGEEKGAGALHLQSQRLGQGGQGSWSLKLDCALLGSPHHGWVLRQQCSTSHVITCSDRSRISTSKRGS